MTVGILLLYGHPLIIIFNLGVSHSFVAECILDTLSRENGKLEIIVVRMPSSERIIVTSY